MAQRTNRKTAEIHDAVAATLEMIAGKYFARFDEDAKWAAYIALQTVAVELEMSDLEEMITKGFIMPIIGAKELSSFVSRTPSKMPPTKPRF